MLRVWAVCNVPDLKSQKEELCSSPSILHWGLVGFCLWTVVLGGEICQGWGGGGGF